MNHSGSEKIGVWTKVAAVSTVAMLSIGVTSVASAVETATVGELVAVPPAAPQPRPALAWLPASAPEPVATPAGAAVDLRGGYVPPPPEEPPGSKEVVAPWLPPSMALPDPATAPAVGEGDESPEVELLERRLTELGYRPGIIDGYFSASTWSAVLAFQKTERLERTGAMDAETWARLAAPQPWRVTSSTRYPRVEVDLERQVVHVVFGPQHVQTLNTSTGGGYEYKNQYGYWEVAETPVGSYNVYRRYDGLEQAPLGSLYRPLYFEAGYAIHGSPYVPDYPDSHGCVRLSDEDQDWLWELAPDDLQVTVYETMDPERLYPGSGRHGAPPLQPGPRPEALQPM
ncbi:MAG: peptidoglycan-binding protein [Acidimicrobiia bacterium]